MSRQNRGQICLPAKKPKRYKAPPAIDFCNIGGLRNHLNTLREIIILPLLHGNVFSYFNIRAPRGVLFHGPPGTGKTLVASALATEINREGLGKVTFFYRKGSDILDKWVGGSEKNLRDLFEKATKSIPAIIFFDELDGLAPIRAKQTEQIHCSVVATLLALLDGLDNKPGVIVIGSTNRIEAIDPALRRPGRFDKELYFSLPGLEARREILEVHTMSWKSKLTSRLIAGLAESTTGFSGADLQALCSEAVIRCMKRNYSCLQGIKVDPEMLKVEECDFLNARASIMPSTLKAGLIMRKLTAVVMPLLQRQLRNITNSIRTLWPHFLQENYKYLMGEERYAGRLLLIGSNTQGVHEHLIPALLQELGYMPSFVYDASNISQKKNFFNIIHHPCVILLSRVDEWWDAIRDCEQLSIASTLEDIHAEMPILVIATCRRAVPKSLYNLFYNHSSALLKIEDPTEEERKAFLKPLFFDSGGVSLVTVLENCSKNCAKESKRARGRNTLRPDLMPGGSRGKRKGDSNSPEVARKRLKLPRPSNKLKLVRSSSCNKIFDIRREVEYERRCVLSPKKCNSCTDFDSEEDIPYFSTVLSSLLDEENANNRTITSLKEYLTSRKLQPGQVKQESTVDANDPQMRHINSLWEHASVQTSRNMAVTQLELLYDVISACINIHWNSFEDLVKNLESILRNIENSESVEG